MDALKQAYTLKTCIRAALQSIPRLFTHMQKSSTASRPVCAEPPSNSKFSSSTNFTRRPKCVYMHIHPTYLYMHWYSVKITSILLQIIQGLSNLESLKFYLLVNQQMLFNNFLVAQEHGVGRKTPQHYIFEAWIIIAENIVVINPPRLLPMLMNVHRKRCY